MDSKHWVWPVVVLYVVLAAAYARVTPYRTEGVVVMQGGVHVKDIGAPDERQHVNYVAHLLSGEGVPVFDPADPQLYESYQSHQPPLFYFMEAGWAKVFGLSDLTGENAGFILRLLNALIGGVAILGVWFLAWWGFASRPHALAAAVVAALLPMNVALGSAVSNDPLLIALCTWCLALCAKGVREGWNVRLAAGAGVLMGLAFLTKTTSIALLPVVCLAFFLRSGEGRALVRPMGGDHDDGVGEVVDQRAHVDALVGGVHQHPARPVGVGAVEGDDAIEALDGVGELQRPGVERR